MNESILKALYEQGPKTITQLANELMVHWLELCAPLVELMEAGNIHLEVDGTFWFAREGEQSASEVAA